MRVGKLLAGMVVVLILMVALACNSAAEPTATATTAPAATPTKAPGATPTATKPAVVASPTPTTAAAPTPTPSIQPKRGGMLNMVTGTYTPNFDPQLLSITPEYYVANGKLYNNLMVNYSGSAVQCEICSDAGWTLENNGKSMVFNLKQGIKFHSGKEMTSADVVYSLKMLTGQIDGIISPRGGVVKEYIDSIEAPSKYVVRINLIRPSPFVPKVLAMATAAIYQDGTTRESLNSKDSGSGPYLVKNTVSGTSWSLVRNPDYFKSGQPYLDGVEITYVGDTNTRSAAFFTHKVRWLAVDDNQYTSRLNQMQADGKISRFTEAGGCGPRFIAMNWTKPPFNDLKMRQAANLAIDRVALGNVWSAQTIMPPSVNPFMFNETEEFGTAAEKVWNIYPGWGKGDKKKQEIEQAKQLVKDAGYATGVDVVQLQRGNPPPSSYHAPDVVQAMLKEIGIRTKLELVSSSDYASRMANMDYNVTSYNYCLTTRDPDEAVGQYWITGGARNWVGYSNPAMDKLYVQMSSELDPTKRRALFDQIQDQFVKDVGWVAVQGADSQTFVWSEVQGFTIGMSTHSASGLHRADRIWFKD